ncbi:MAG TPA: VOC family protein [Burkholderiales bacterium]|nr:VOC family protein [Burkholderiales bacterium]
MLTRIDHVMICVPDLDRGIDAYARIGFGVHPGGVHTGKGTHNAIAFLEDDYLELLAIRDKAEYLAHSQWGGLVEFLERGGGLRYVIVQSDDLAADVAAMRARGVEVSEPSDGARRTPAGRELRWKAATLGDRNPLPVFFIQHLTPLKERRLQVPDAGRHPNGVQRIERAYIAVTDIAAAAKNYSRVLGLAPKMERGTVINADMAIYQLGPTALGLAQPSAPGVCADALARRGPGPFQILYRTRSMDAAAKWIAHHGLPPPTRGIRNTGEHAMLVLPGYACGVYIGFVGPA